MTERDRKQMQQEKDKRKMQKKIRRTDLLKKLILLKKHIKKNQNNIRYKKRKKSL